MKQTVFISRPVEEALIFQQELADINCTVICKSMVSFSGLPMKNLPQVDWVFFYSKNGVRFFFQNPEVHDYLAPTKVGAMGAGTAAAILSQNVKPDFVGRGNPKAVSQAFLPHVIGAKVGFVQALHSRQSVQKEIGHAIEAIDIITYQNIPSPTIIDQPLDILVFTSPLNVTSFLQAQPILPHHQIVAIGTSTEDLLISKGYQRVFRPMLPTETELAKTVIELIGG